MVGTNKFAAVQWEDSPSQQHDTSFTRVPERAKAFNPQLKEKVVLLKET